MKLPDGPALQQLLERRSVRQFQSTPPSRGATADPPGRQRNLLISIHAPLAGGDEIRDHLTRLCGISIHAPLAGGDP